MINPRMVPEQQDQQFIQWVQRESIKLTNQGYLTKSPQQTRMLKFWELYRPEMFNRLQQWGIAKQLAQVLDHKADQAFQQNLDAGMYRTDAQEQAEQDWFLLEPEAEDQPEELDDLEELTPEARQILQRYPLASMMLGL